MQLEDLAYFYQERNLANRPMSRTLEIVICLVALSRFSHALHECRSLGWSELHRPHGRRRWYKARDRMEGMLLTSGGQSLLAGWSDGLGPAALSALV